MYEALKKLAIWACICTLPMAAIAQPILSDSRIKTLVYNENEVYNVTTHYGYQANIEFGLNESVEAVSVGDRIAWQIVPAGRRLFIRAMEENAHTNMTVITSKRAYQFDLRSSASNAVFGSAELTYVLRFYYPEAEGIGVVPASFTNEAGLTRQPATLPPSRNAANNRPPAPFAGNISSAATPVTVQRAPAFAAVPPAPTAQAVPVPAVHSQNIAAAQQPVQSQPVPFTAATPYYAPYNAPNAPLPNTALLSQPPSSDGFAPSNVTEPFVPPPAPVHAAALSPLQPIATPYANVPTTQPLAPPTNNVAPPSFAPQPAPAPQPAAAPVNFRYTYSGSDDAAPVKIFDDGRSTYFKFRTPPVNARFSVITPKGEEYEVPHRFNPDGLAVIDVVAPKVRFSEQHGQVIVYNEVLG